MNPRRNDRRKKAVTILVVLISVGLLLPSFAGIVSVISQ
ncbi:hypothetical protein SAMN00017405_1762 [Desulfonispora thiosulfatigenes DSM 11270]|uniref:DUF4044 domain-containing protein n=1 Tax=Desulfonispora thiosulfatigenes DSM 11270 TaxID=656914 RepID=A0A1W1V422_DESTI|nr:hypothetical protein SAMN00017405_1762 [Desulfonispora thiosulfatigenes DSM 11270]